MVGPYADDLGNVLPNAVEGVGVPVDPLAFAGLLGETLVDISCPQRHYGLYFSLNSQCIQISKRGGF